MAKTKVDETEKEGVSKLTKVRYSHKARLWVIGVLLVIVGVLFVFWGKMRVVLAIAFIALLGAFGLEVSQSDWDLGQLWRLSRFRSQRWQRHGRKYFV